MGATDGSVAKGETACIPTDVLAMTAAGSGLGDNEDGDSTPICGNAATGGGRDETTGGFTTSGVFGAEWSIGSAVTGDSCFTCSFGDGAGSGISGGMTSQIRAYPRARRGSRLKCDLEP